MVATFSTRRAAQASGLSEKQVRGYVHAGLIEPLRGPRGAFRFSFQDVVILRASRALNRQGVSTRRVRDVLRQVLASKRGRDRLSAVSFEHLGHDLAVRDDVGLWEPDSDQRWLDLFSDHLELPEPVAAPFGKLTVVEGGTSTGGAEPEPATKDDVDADDWYQSGFQLEESSPGEAEAAYRHAIALRPTHGAAHANLGRLLHERGRFEEAERHYRLALACDADDVTAAYNLGVVLEDLGRGDDAFTAYQEALRIDPRHASAHFNLARLYESRGQKAEALEHLVAYRRALPEA